MNPKLPRGIRNHNPGNIRWRDPWQGLIPKPRRSDTAFCQFQSAAYGIRALARTLITYQDKHGLATIRSIITRWAPPTENDTAAYIAAVAHQTGQHPERTLDLHRYSELHAVLEAIIRHENGRGQLASPNTWYDEATVRRGLTLAGVEPVTPAAAQLPITRETLGASATGSAGVAQIADVISSTPMDTLAQASDHLASGSALRLGIGVALIAVALLIAYSQIQRHQAGTL